MVGGWRLGPRGRLAACATAVAAVSTAYGAYSAAADARLVSSATGEFETALAEHRRDRSRLGGYRDTYLALIDYERSIHVACARRRIYSTTRWDYPLDLQSVRFDNLVFDSRGQTFSPRLLAWQQPGRSCDYVIADQPTLDTLRGALLVNLLKSRQALRLAATHDRYVVSPFGRGRRRSSTAVPGGGIAGGVAGLRPAIDGNRPPIV